MSNRLLLLVCVVAVLWAIAGIILAWRFEP